MSQPDTFYHYCNIDVLLSILRNNELRLSDVEKSNDYAERKWMTGKIEYKFAEIVSKSKLIEKKDKLINSYSELGKGFFSLMANVYSTCFSTNGDLLSQWRAYSQDGYGVAIGFNGKILEEVNNDPYGLMFSPVTYSLNQQDKYATTQAERIFDLFMRGDNLIHAMSDVLTNDLKKLCTFKNPEFSEEKEWRLCAALLPDIRIGTKGYHFGPFEISEVKLFSNNRKIVTYFDLNYSKVKNEIINEIVLGPKCQMSEKDISQVLRLLDYNTGVIEIRKSKSTYQ